MGKYYIKGTTDVGPSFSPSFVPSKNVWENDVTQRRGLLQKVLESSHSRNWQGGGGVNTAGLFR